MPTSAKLTSNQVRRFFPFLTPLLDSAGVTGRNRLRVHVKATAVEVTPPHHDAVSRFTSAGSTAGQAIAHYAGSLDTAANQPAELVDSGSPIHGRAVNTGYFYAVLDLLEFYGLRDLTIYLSEADIGSLLPEVKNQLCLNAPA